MNQARKKRLLASMKGVISLDSTGTLLKISESVGYQYLRILDSFFPGSLSHRDKVILTRQFNENFPLHYKDATKKYPNFGYGGIGCYEWWKGLVRQLYLSSHINMKDYQFSYVFAETYRQFRTTECWEMFPETLQVLQALQTRGFDVVVTSDFDQGLVTILQQHGLFTPDNISSSLIKEVITSYEEGVAKPELLELVKEKWDISAHVGDSFGRDVLGAQRIGVLPIFIDRKKSGASMDHPSVQTLSGILEHLK